MGRKSSGQNYQGAGGFYRQSDRTGFTVRAYDTKGEWTGLLVEESVWEARQPQDLVRGVRDDQTVQSPRPLSPPVWDGPIYIALNADMDIGDTFVPLGSIAGLTVGDEIGVMTNLGEFFNANIISIVSAGVNISAPITAPASSGNMMVDHI